MARSLFRTAAWALAMAGAFCASAQGKFTINGRVKVDGGSLDGTRVVVYKDGEKQRTVNNNLSKFTLDLELNSAYILSFEKEGFVTKKLSFDTHAPAEAAANGFTAFDFAVSLFKQYDDVNTVVFNQPVGIIRYDKNMDDFDFDTDYTKSIQSALAEAQKEVEQKQAEEKQKEEANAKAAAEAQKKAAAQAQAEAQHKKDEEAAAKKAEQDRLSAEKKAEQDRAAAAKKAEQERIAAEKKKAEEERQAQAKPPVRPKPEPAPPVPPPAQAKVEKAPRPKPAPPAPVRRTTTGAQAHEGSDTRRAIQPMEIERGPPEVRGDQNGGGAPGGADRGAQPGGHRGASGRGRGAQRVPQGRAQV
ncbi:MAG: hypothetical protein QM724_09820 [Flavobacteriales bacterium]